MTSAMNLWGFLCFEAILTIIAVYYCIIFFQHRNEYPLKQLSPIIAICQGFSFYLCQLTLLTLIVFYSDSVVILDKTNGHCDSSIENANPYVFVSIVYVLSRGLCFSLTVVKSYRVLIGFQREKISKSSWKYICRSELFLLIIGFLYGILGFPVVSIISTVHHQFPMACLLQVYEGNFGGVKFNSWVEEFITLFVLYAVNTHKIHDKLLQLTFILQELYIFWFSVNSILSQFVSIQYIELSCFIRSILMFIGFILWPLYLKEQYPNLYITLKEIENFQDIISDKFRNFYLQDNFVLEQFKKYLIYLDSVNFPLTYSGIQFNEMNHQQFFLLFLRLRILRLQQHKDDDMYLQLENVADFNAIYKNKDYDYEEILTQMELYLSNLYSIKYKCTKAFYHLSQLYCSNQVVTYNFEMLNISLDEAHQIFEKSDSQEIEQ